MWGNNNKCLDCGEPFNKWDRTDKKFCNGTCRKSYDRKKKLAEKTCDKLQSQLNHLNFLLDNEPLTHTEDTMLKMKDLSDHINELIEQYEQSCLPG